MPKSDPSLLKLTREYEKSHLKSAEDLIINLEWIFNEIKNINVSARILEKHFMVKILNNLNSENDGILDGLDFGLTLSGDNV